MLNYEAHGHSFYLLSDTDLLSIPVCILILIHLTGLRCTVLVFILLSPITCRHEIYHPLLQFQYPLLPSQIDDNEKLPRGLKGTVLS